MYTIFFLFDIEHEQAELSRATLEINHWPRLWNFPPFLLPSLPSSLLPSFLLSSAILESKICWFTENNSIKSIRLGGWLAGWLIWTI